MGNSGPAAHIDDCDPSVLRPAVIAESELPGVIRYRARHHTPVRAIDDSVCKLEAGDTGHRNFGNGTIDDLGATYLAVTVCIDEYDPSLIPANPLAGLSG